MLKKLLNWFFGLFKSKPATKEDFAKARKKLNKTKRPLTNHEKLVEYLTSKGYRFHGW